jgi:hypothetical protein
VASASVELPPDLVRDALEHAYLHDAPAFGDAARAALEHWPQRMLRELTSVAAEASRRSPGFRSAFLERLRCDGESLTGEEAWDAWRNLLQGSLGAEERDLAAAREALDSLEMLAQSRVFAPRMLELLDGRQNWEPAWTETDADNVRFRLYEQTGHLNEAKGVLVSIIHQLITDRQPGADDLIALLRELGSSAEDLDTVCTRYRLTFGAEETRPTGDRASRAAGQRIRVLFVGGNEQQEAYQGYLDEFVASRYPFCAVDFQFTGWGANWGRIVKTLDAKLEEADVLILMHFIRTELGRTMRRLANEHDIPWVACTGHGRRSLERSIATAIAVAGKRTVAS